MRSTLSFLFRFVLFCFANFVTSKVFGTCRHQLTENMWAPELVTGVWSGNTLLVGLYTINESVVSHVAIKNPCRMRQESWRISTCLRCRLLLKPHENWTVFHSYTTVAQDDKAKNTSAVTNTLYISFCNYQPIRTLSKRFIMFLF